MSWLRPEAERVVWRWSAALPEHDLTLLCASRGPFIPSESVLAGDIARTCWLAAGLSDVVPGTTIDRQCGSSQQAVHFAAQAIMAGVNDVVSMKRFRRRAANL